MSISIELASPELAVPIGACRNYLADNSQDRHIARRFALLTAAFLAVHFVLRLLHSPSVSRDDAELVLMDQALAWAYSEQPPLYSWLYRPLTLLFGPSVFSLTLLRISTLGATVFLLYACIFEVTRNRRLSALGTSSVLLVPLLSWHSLTYLTHSVSLTLCCAATLLFFLRAVRRGAWSDYLGLGLSIGLGTLSKYNYVFFLAALVTAGVTLAPVRRSWWNRRMLAAALLAGLVVLPHACYVVYHFASLASVYASKSAPIPKPLVLGLLTKGTVDLLMNFVLLPAPLIAVFLISVPAALRRNVSTDAESMPGLTIRLLNRYFLALFAYHLAYVLATSATRFHERWLEPFFVLLPVLLACHLSELKIEPRQLRRLSWCIACFAIGLTVARGGYIYFGRVRGYQAMDSQFAAAAHELDLQLPAGTVILTNDESTAGNLRMHLPGRVFVCATAKIFASKDPPAAERYAVVWNAAEALPPRLRELTARCGVLVSDTAQPAFLELAPAYAGGRPARLAYVQVPVVQVPVP